MNGLRSHIKNSKECFIRYPNTSKSVKKTRLRLVFSTHFSGFGYPDETLFLVFDILHQDCQQFLSSLEISMQMLTLVPFLFYRISINERSLSYQQHIETKFHDLK